VASRYFDTLIRAKNNVQLSAPNMPYNFRPRPNRKRPYVGRALGRRVRQRSGRSFTAQSQTRRNPRSGQGVTTQHDERRIYVKRSMPRFKRRAWKRFTYKIHAVAEKDLGSRSVIFNKSQAFSNTTSGNHGLGYCALYSAGGTGDSFMSDMTNMSGLENSGNPTAAAGSTVGDSTKFIFKSAIMDVTFRNTSGIWSADQTPVNTLTSEAKLEVDVYEILSSKEWTNTANDYSDITSALGLGATQTLNIGGTGTGVTLALRGVTPWDLPAALGFWRIKILKKTKFMVPNSDTFTYQIRDPKRRIVMQEKMETQNGGNKPGWTRHLLVLFKLTPGLTVGSTSGTYREQLTMGITRKYFYKIDGSSEDRDRYLANT